MADCVAMLRELKAMGATKVALHADGSVASVEFGVQPAQVKDQHEGPKDPHASWPRSPTGGLVPRARSSE